MLLEHEEIATALREARAFRVRHASHDVGGVATEATGLVIVPTAPGEDRPILTWCHGTTGLGDAACPSAQPDPARALITYFTPEATQQIDFGVPGVQAFLDDGWIVCATDYQGLGTPGMHQYAVNRTNAIDAVSIARAARELGVGAGTVLASAGWSQGGGACAAVAELDDADYGELRLIGCVPMSPAVPSIALRQPSGPAAGLADATIPPDSHLVMLLCGTAAACPELDLADVLTPLGRELMGTAWNHQPVHHLNDTLARAFRLKGPILAVDQARMPAWVAAFERCSAARVRPRCPILLCVDAFDGGTVVPVPWQTAYAAAVTGLGGQIETRVYPDDDHFSLPDSCVDDARAWLALLR